ncbi:MAG: DUF4339 domain-containing protein [Anaplasmataceae bacterium]|nr:DUF4339 domain-containing protein [Anaplasmataceae bacterium]
MNFSLLISLWIIQGAISAYIAHNKARNPYIWFALGCFFGLFGILAVVLVKPIRKKEPIAQPLVQPTLPNYMWYYLDNSSKQFGPLSTYGLQSALREGKVSLASYVWNESMQEWKVLKEICQDFGISTDSSTL